MASFHGVHGAMLSLETYLQRTLPGALRQGTVNARVVLLGSADMGRPLNGNMVGLYLHRVTVDPYGRNRPLAPLDPNSNALEAELPVNLHFLLIANGSSAAIESSLLSWAMVSLASETHLDMAQLNDSDPEWGRKEQVAIAPADMTDEDLIRIWDQFEAAYTLSVPYVMRTVRLRLRAEETEGPDIGTRALPVGRI